ncbi:MAG: diguanylate cyclase [Halothiobacillaceae bacterium]
MDQSPLGRLVSGQAGQLDPRAYRQLFEQAPLAIIVHDPDTGKPIDANQNALRHYGVDSLEALAQLDLWADPPYDESTALRHIERARKEGPQHLIWKTVRHDGLEMWEDVYLTVMSLNGRPAAVAIYADVSALRRLESREKRQNRILESMVKGAALEDVLAQIVLSVEAEDPGSRCSILLLDETGQRLTLGAAPNLPEFYNQAVEGLAIGPAAGSCGTAAHRRSRVVVEDIASHPYWEGFREIARQAGLGACWSEPVLARNGEVLATFAIYHGEARRPDAEDIERIQSAADLASLAIERDRNERALRQRNALEELVREISMHFLALPTNRLDHGIDEALGRIGRFSNADRCYLFLIDEGGQRMHNSHEWCARGVASQKAQLQDLATADFPWWMEHVRRTEALSPDPETMTRMTEAERAMFDQGEIRSLLAVPMFHGSLLKGFLGLDSVRSTRHWSEQDRRLYQIVAGIFSEALARHRLELRLQHEASHDELTGLCNRHRMTQLLAVEVERARRYATPFSVLIFDIDHFKQVNDRFGHDVGDLVLIELAHRVGSTLRASDALARWGGEEFLVLLPETPLAQGRELAELLRRRVAEHDFSSIGKLSISIGLTCFRVSDDSNQIFKRADQALYEAKGRGRDQIVVVD